MSQAEAKATTQADEDKSMNISELRRLEVEQIQEKVAHHLCKLMGDEWKLGRKLYMDTAKEILDDIALPELLKALEPFADAADDLEDDHKDMSSIWECPAAVNIDAGHLRAARRVSKGRKL